MAYSLMKALRSQIFTKCIPTLSPDISSWQIYRDDNTNFIEFNASGR